MKYLVHLGKLVNVLPKDIILFVVEGVTDDTALGHLLRQALMPKDVRVYFMGCDITTSHGITPANVIAELGRGIGLHIRKYGWTFEDIKLIVHIIDTDGAFIPEDKIVEDKVMQYPAGENKMFYDDEIRAFNRNQYVKRNLQKKSNVNKLYSKSEIANRPYRMIYMSNGLEHVLHNIANPLEEEKMDLAYEFEDRFYDNIPGFVDFICNSDFSVKGDYIDSWKYIKDGTNSLKRHSNLGILIEEMLK